MLEGSSVRLFAYHKRVYACARPAGRLTRVPSESRQQQQLSQDPHYQLAGRFVEAYQSSGSYVHKIFVTDTRSGKTRLAAYYKSLNGLISDDVLDADGTVVWITSDGDLGQGGVYENTPSRTLTLDYYQYPNEFGDPPMTSLALSDSVLDGVPDRHTVYWMDRGVLKSARIP